MTFNKINIHIKISNFFSDIISEYKTEVERKRSQERDDFVINVLQRINKARLRCKQDSAQINPYLIMRLIVLSNESLTRIHKL